jgi:hypothetical protein
MAAFYQEQIYFVGSEKDKSQGPINPRHAGAVLGN